MYFDTNTNSTYILHSWDFLVSVSLGINPKHKDIFRFSDGFGLNTISDLLSASSKKVVSVVD